MSDVVQLKYNIIMAETNTNILFSYFSSVAYETTETNINIDLGSVDVLFIF